MTVLARHPFDVVARVLADRLREQGPSPEVVAAVKNRTMNWERVVGMASEHLVLPAFAGALRDLDLAGALEPELRGFLSCVHDANFERNERLREQLSAAIGILNRVGIEPVLLKGAIRLVDGLYPDIGWRMMWDLDILVPEAAFKAAVEALQRSGFVVAGEVEPDRKDVKLRRRDICIEVHRELFWTRRKQQLLRGAEVIEASRPAVTDGGMARLPSREHQLVHLIGHSQIAHFNHIYGRIALRDRFEAAMLLRSSGCLDREAVFTRFVAAGYRRPLLVFLLSLSDGGFCGALIPGRVDALTKLQRRRIAVQARSETVRRVGLYVGWWIVLLKTQLDEQEAGGWRKVGRTLEKVAFNPDHRRRIARIVFSGRPRVW